MSFIPFHDGIQAAWQFLDRMLHQHHVDIQKLWKALQDLNGPRESGGGQETNAYNITNQFRRWARLTAACHAGSTSGSVVAAVIQQYSGGSYSDTDDPAAYPDFGIGADGAITVNGGPMFGYAFADEIVEVEYDINFGLWLVKSEGRGMVRGTLGGTLSNGSSASVTLARGGSVTGYDALGLATSIASGKKVWLSWNRDTLHWEVVSAQC